MSEDSSAPPSACFFYFFSFLFFFTAGEPTDVSMWVDAESCIDIDAFGPTCELHVHSTREERTKSSTEVRLCFFLSVVESWR